jgi:hypothetical protein
LEAESMFALMMRFARDHVVAVLAPVLVVAVAVTAAGAPSPFGGELARAKRRPTSRSDTAQDVALIRKVARTLRGPQGPDGPRGPQGLRGPQGPQGNTGPAGATGGASVTTFIGRMNNLGATPSPPSPGPPTIFDGGPSGISTATQESSPSIQVAMLSPNAALTARDLSVSLTAAPGATLTRTFQLEIVGGSVLLTCTIPDPVKTCTSGAQTASIPAGSALVLTEQLTGTPSGSPPNPADALFGWRASG